MGQMVYKKGGRPKGPQDPYTKKAIKPHHPQINREERKVFKMSPVIYRRLLNHYLSVQAGQLAKDAEDETLPAYRRMVANLVNHSMRVPDVYRIDFLLSRLIGKMPDEVKVKTDDEFSKMSDAELEAEFNRLQADNAVTLGHLEQTEWWKQNAVIDVTPKKDDDNGPKSEN